jgi:glycine cleavage system aminomethyltransferase T
MDIHTNPFELGLDRLVDLEMEAEFIGKAALTRIARQGVTRRQMGIEIDGVPLSGPNNEYWPVMVSDIQVGRVTSAIYSPRLERNIALAMLSVMPCCWKRRRRNVQSARHR